MSEGQQDWVKTLLDRVGSIPPGHRIALESAHLERTNGVHTLFYGRKIDEHVLQQHLQTITEIAGTPVKLEYRQNGHATPSLVTGVQEKPLDPRPELRNLGELHALDMTGYRALEATFQATPFEIFDNNRAAVSVLSQLLATFPDKLAQKTRPICLVGGVGVGKTSILEHVVCGLEAKRRKALRAFSEPDPKKALAIAKELMGKTAQSERELWERVRALASVRICYENARSFRDTYAQLGKLSQKGNMERLDIIASRFDARHENLDFWAVDDLQVFARGDPIKTLERFYGIMGDLFERQRLLVATSDRSPALFANFPEHTRSRLCENICDVLVPSEKDKEHYARLRIKSFKQKGVDLEKYAVLWTPVIVKVANHYRDINAIFNYLMNNGFGQKSVPNPNEVFEHALQALAKDQQQARGAYEVQRIINTVVSLAGITEKEIKNSERRLKQYRQYDSIAAKRTALVLAATRTTLHGHEIAGLLGYVGEQSELDRFVKAVVKEYDSVHLDPTRPVEQGFLPVYNKTKRILHDQQTPLFRGE